MDNIKKKNYIEVEGNTIGEAVKKAAAIFGVPRDRINITILSEEQKGLFGMQGVKPAKIKASLIPQTQIKKQA